ncbi:MAG: alpha-ketoglutarate-dependent dioxygenase AlkB [Methylomonas sp.]|nr:alpha-ketoglutarate-dependent dioxygenase AlkB [Methylomonas sp.]PPD22788.1 MAG: alpha-ketoglutarate-dependent dioxygenase AlkB [Methylomonas sp.]PPD23905.1 MAG: alpha-ketoglutarate-dependent dioxygenase AlkB [Methylomonas sp.]PPD31959.1 MAG: alpha-ketoglutarate-dependent dioxygenase AlkB [Methylomonas sp.]PPD42774.1 MAG: alpha-ketoglutarate-dependent dioxygenase AlkB [Methylomonas sp.]
MYDKSNHLPLDGELYCWRGFYSNEQADDWFRRLHSGLAWQQERLFIYGRWLDVPRLMAWYGDAGARYRYSHVDHDPLPWTGDLLHLRNDVEAACHAGFNSVLANLYRDGCDSMGCHADDENELGINPVIASLSFGATRLLRFKHSTGVKVDVELAHGDLLLMAGTLQHHWRHELPKTRRAKQARINLTFRRILRLS